MIVNSRKIYLYTSWVPLTLHIIANLHLQTLDGWSQWAIGKVVIPSIVLSAFYVITGLLLFFTKFNNVSTVRYFPLSILLSGSVILWFLMRYIVLEIKMSFL